MADMLKTGAQFLADSQKTYASRSVTYTQGAHSITVDATVGRTTFKFSDEQANLRIVFGDRDYLIPAAQLVVNGVQIEPARGDTITDTNDPTGTTTWLVAPPTGASKEPAWRWGDAHKIRLRIHCKQTSTVS